MKSLWSWGFLTAVWHFARFKTYSLIKETKSKPLDKYNHYLQPKMLHFCNDKIRRIINKASITMQSISMTKLLVLSKRRLTDVSSHQKWHYAFIYYLSTIYYSYFPHPSAHCSTDSTWFLSSHTFISFHLPIWILAPLPGAQSKADWQDFYQKSSYKYRLGREKEKNGEGWMGGRGNKNRSPVSCTNIW